MEAYYLLAWLTGNAAVHIGPLTTTNAGSPVANPRGWCGVVQRTQWKDMIGSGVVNATVLAWRREQLVETLQSSELLAWALLVGLSGTDIVLTVLGLQQGLVELNPLARAAIATGGVAALIPLKLLALGIAGIGWSCLPSHQRLVVLIALLVPTTGVVFHNAHIVLG